MTLPVLAPDVQDTWSPVWRLLVGPFSTTPGFTVQSQGTMGVDVLGAAVETSAFTWTTRDVDLFSTFGDGRIINGDTLSVNRSLMETRWGIVTIQDVSVVLWNGDSAIGDLREQVVKLDRLDLVTAFWRTEFVGLVDGQSGDTHTVTLTLRNMAQAMLEEQIPKSTFLIRTKDVPNAADVEKVIPWVMGRPYNMPLLNVRDDQINELYDYLLGFGALGLTAARRLDPQDGPPFEIDPTECEPAHGIIGANLGMELWSGGTSVAPDGWTLTGFAAAIAQDTVPAHVHGGTASAQLTRGLPASPTFDARILQDLATIDANFPLAWWQGRMIAVSAWVWSQHRRRATIGCADGVTQVLSDPHTGSNALELLTFTMVLSPSATKVEISGSILGLGDAIASYDDFTIRVSARALVNVPHGTLGANLGMETWSGGVSVAPDNWTVTGFASAIARDATAGHVHGGLYAAQLTRGLPASPTFDARLSQDLSTIDPNYPLAWWQGQTIIVMAWVWSINPGRARIYGDDGMQVVFSSAHTGSGTLEPLEFMLTISEMATQVLIYGGLLGYGDCTAAFDDFTIRVVSLTWADVPRTDLYAGLTVIRMLERQEQSGGTLFQIAADLRGLQPERNAARAIRTLLSDPVNGLGKAVDAESFDQAEVDAAFSYQDLVMPDTPQVLLEFDEASLMATDSSGYARHGWRNIRPPAPPPGITNPATGAGSVGDNGDYALNARASGPELYVTVPYDPAFDPTPSGIEFDVWYQPLSILLTRPIAEKLIGTLAFSGQALYQEAVDASHASIVFSVTTTTGSFTVRCPITPADVGVWMHLVGQAGVTVHSPKGLRIYRDGVLMAEGTYTGTLSAGRGDLLIAKFGVAGPNRGNGYIDKFSLYTAPSSATRIAARAQGRAYPPDGPTTYDEMVAFFRVTPDYYFRLGEASGTTMVNTLGLAGNGVYVGGPTLGVPGGLNAARGWTHGDTAVRFENDIAQYGRVVAPTISGTALTVMALYRPNSILSQAGLVEKTIGGTVNTSWLLYQEGATIVFRVKDNATVLQNITVPVTTKDVGSYLFIVATYDTGTMKLYRNGVLAMTGTYAPPVATGVGDLFIGKLGSNIYAGQGDYDEVVIWSGTAITADEVMAFYTAGTWGPGGLMVDLALLDQPVQAQKILNELCSLRGMRLGVNTEGAYTLRVDSIARDTIRMVVRDGIGEGERTLIQITGRQHVKDTDGVKDLIIRYRPDLVKANVFLRTITRAVSVFGADLTVDLFSIREDVTADRVSYYMAERLKNDETVTLQITQEGRQIGEGDLLTLIYAALNYAGETVEVRSVEKGLTVISTEAAAWTDTPYTYAAGPFPVGALPG